jgi:RNA polymerase sigma factor (sigma-70 family)
MGYRAFGNVVRDLRRLVRAPAAADPEDCQLLERFVRERDEAAFTTLVQRHGPMVLGVCRRLLHDPHAADDAFQATFLVLVRKAHSLRRRELLAGWLYGVAQRTALKARSLAIRRQQRERQAMTRPDPAPDTDVVWQDLRPVLDEELARLPARYRLPVVLCYLEGRTLTEAAEQLGWPSGTVSGRLARARELLRKRLTRRGVTLSAGLLGTVLAQQASAAVPSPLLTATVQAAGVVAAGSAAETLSPSVVHLMEGVLHAMFLTKVKIVVGVALGACLIATGLLAYPSLAGQPDTGPGAAAAPPAPAQAAAPPPVAAPNQDGIPIPPLATFDAKKVQDLLDKSKASDRIKGLLKAKYDAARLEMDSRVKEFYAGRGTLDISLGSSLRLLEAERELSDRKEDQVAALENHFKRMRVVEQVNEARFQAGRIAVQDLAQSTFYRVQAEIWLERAKAK